MYYILYSMYYKRAQQVLPRVLFCSLGAPSLFFALRIHSRILRIYIIYIVYH